MADKGAWQRLLGRRVIGLAEAEAARLWRGDHDMAARLVMASVDLCNRRERVRQRGDGYVMDCRTIAERRFREACRRLEEFEPVCRAVIIREQGLGEWASQVGVNPHVATDRLRLGLGRLVRFYQVREEVA